MITNLVIITILMIIIITTTIPSLTSLHMLLGVSVVKISVEFPQLASPEGIMTIIDGDDNDDNYDDLCWVDLIVLACDEVSIHQPTCPNVWNIGWCEICAG